MKMMMMNGEDEGMRGDGDEGDANQSSQMKEKWKSWLREFGGFVGLF